MITRNYIYTLSSAGGVDTNTNTEKDSGAFAAYKTTDGVIHCDKSISTNFEYISYIIRRMLGRNLPSRTENTIEFEDLNKADSNNGMISYIYLGSGTTAPTYDDYTLESPIPLTKLKISNFDIVRAADFDTLFTISSIVENISNENIDVSEIAWVFKSDNDGYSIGAVLLARETFDTITIKPGEIRSFVMTIK